MHGFYVIGVSFALLVTSSASAILDADSHPYKHEWLPQANNGNEDAHSGEFSRIQRLADIRLASPDFHDSNVKRDIEKEPWYGIYECEKMDWKGKCQWRQTVPVGERVGGCFNRLFPGPNGSVGIDKGIFCSGFLDVDCKGTYRTVDYTYSLFRGAPEFQNPMSFRCWKPRFGDPAVEVDYEDSVQGNPILTS